MPPRIKFGKIVPKGGIHDHQMCMKKDKLACGTRFLNVVDSILDHVARVKSAKKTWANLFVTFERWHASNKLNQFQKLCNLKMEEGIGVQVHIDKFCMITNQLANIDHIVFDENLAFTNF